MNHSGCVIPVYENQAMMIAQACSQWRRKAFFLCPYGHTTNRGKHSSECYFHRKNNQFGVVSMSRYGGRKAGFGFGVVIAVALSWDANHSILWAIVHGFLSWVYVIYYLIFKWHVRYLPREVTVSSGDVRRSIEHAQAAETSNHCKQHSLIKLYPFFWSLILNI